MTVVRNEYESNENDPSDALQKLIWSTAYQAHPYHHSTIGWKSDIENVSIDRLRNFYDTFYWPNNATVTILGDINIESVLSLVKKYFGEYTKSPKSIPEMLVQEPKQEGSRRFIINRSGSKTIVGIGYKSPSGTHKDTAAMLVLTNILTGGKRSRFYRKFIDRGLATSVDVHCLPFHDNGLFEAYATLAPGVKPEKIEKLVLAEYSTLKRKGITAGELKRTKAQVRASTSYQRDGTYAIAGEINEAIAMGDWTAYVKLPEAIEQVTIADVKRVAETYLIDDQSTTGYFIPKNS
jgi:zinc protease